MSYQNINQYVFRRWLLKPLNEVSDISLASDEKDYDQEVIFSPLLIGEGDGNRMPINMDFNSSGVTECIGCGDFEKDTVVSNSYWNPTDKDLVNCGVITSICDVGLTGIDNGLVDKFSGETIYLNSGLYTSTSDKFSRKKYDRRFKMHPVTGFTTPSDRILNDNSYDYLISSGTNNNSVGRFISFSGGFYQGFYKSFGYDYQVLPERFHLGWGTEFLLRYRWTGNTDVGLNARYPENKGIFFYYGTRAENKFYHYANGSPITDSGYTRVTEGLNCLETCGCSSSAATASTCHYVYQQSGVTSQNCSCGQCPCNCTSYASIRELNPLYDGVSNALSLRLSGETASPRLCVKTYRITGGCETTGTCTTGLTYTTGTSVTEWCSTRGIFDDCSGTTYLEEERWVQINAVFERNTYLDDCDLLYKGGLGEIVKTVYTASSANNSISLVEPPITHEKEYDPATVEVVNITERWVNEEVDRLGRMKFYVNGKLFLVVENFEEIIPRPLNTSKETQIGVAYNISLGGGTQGLHDNLTVTGCADSISGMTYQQDPECLTTETLDETIYSGLTTHIRLEKYFGGSFFGDISAFRFYTEPLNGGQVRHNFNILKDRYDLLNPFCLKCGDVIEPSPTPTSTQTSTPTPTPTETPTVTPTETSTQTPTETPTETPTVTPTETSTQTPTETPTETPTVTPTSSVSSRFAFNVVYGPSYGVACPSSSGTTIYGDNSTWSSNTQFYNNASGPVTIDMSNFYNYLGEVIELDSSGQFVSGVLLCPTPNPTETPTTTPSESPTLTPTPTLTPWCLYDDCYQFLTITFTAETSIGGYYCTPTGPEYYSTMISEAFYPATQTLSAEFCFSGGTWVELSGDSITSMVYSVSCCNVTPTPTNTETPTLTPTPTNTPTPTETPTNTPTPTETPTNTPTPSPTQPIGVVTSGLQLYLNAGDNDSYPGTGTTWTDLSPNSYSTTLIGGVGFSSVSAETLTFNGVNQYVDTNQSLASESFTVGAWFRTTAGGIKMILSKEENAGNPWNYRIWMSGGQITGDMSQSPANQAQLSSILTNYNNGNWYQVMFTRDDSNWYLYVNGVQVNTRVDPYVGSVTNSQEVWIGQSAYSGGSYDYTGDISEVMIYNRVLSSLEILQNYNATKTRFGY